MFCTIVHFYSEECLASHSTPKLEDHPLMAVHDCIFNIFTATLHVGSHSSIHILRTHHAMVTGTHSLQVTCTLLINLCYPSLLQFVYECFIGLNRISKWTGTSSNSWMLSLSSSWANFIGFKWPAFAYVCKQNTPANSFYMCNQEGNLLTWPFKG
jgi:hypothetical protein